MLECPTKMGIFIYTLNGRRVLLDVSTSLTFEIDAVTEAVLEAAWEFETKEILTHLGSHYGISEVMRVLEKLGTLRDLGLLADRYAGYKELQEHDAQNNVPERLDKNVSYLKESQSKRYNTKISVVIPAYNAGNFIADAIDSVLCQTFRDFEIIVVNDGSTDNTEEVLRRYKDKIRYVTQENHGIAHALNTGCAMAEGQYIALLDADDTYFPTAIERLVACLETNPDVGLVYSNSIIEQLEPGASYKLIHVSPEYQKNLLLHDCYFTHAKAFHKVCWKMLDGFNESYSSAVDYEMFLRFEEQFKMAHINERLYRRRMHGKNISYMKSSRQEENSLRAVQEAVRRRGLNYSVVQKPNTSYKLVKDPREEVFWKQSIFGFHQDMRAPFLINLREIVIDSQLVALANWLREKPYP